MANEPRVKNQRKVMWGYLALVALALIIGLTSSQIEGDFGTVLYMLGYPLLMLLVGAGLIFVVTRMFRKR